MRYLYTLLMLPGMVFLCAQNTLVIQPSQECAKETLIWRLNTQTGPFGPTNTRNYDGITYLPIMNWTWNGSSGQRFILFDFLYGVAFPEDVTVISAKLSLYAPPESTSDGFHSLESNTGKPSIAVIQRITSPWEADEVTWDTQPSTTTADEIVLPAPTGEMQDYPDIDVTALIQAQIANPDEGHGLLIRMRETDYYRKLIFAGSAAEDPTLRPKLVIEYEGAATHTTPVPLDLLYTEYHQMCPGDSYTIYPIDTSLISAYNWSTGETTPTIVVQDTGAYSLIATFGDCLELEAIDTIMILWGNWCFDPEPCEVFFPDIFSPNQDGTNDEFRAFFPEECSLLDFNLEVYNRWGQQVFQSTDPRQGWRGDYQNKITPADVYIYHAQYNLAGTDEPIKRSGQLTLVR